MSDHQNSHSQRTQAVIPILMPDFGNSMEEGTILKWKVSEGDSISVGQVLCEVETDKAVMDFESPEAGRLARIVVPANQGVLVRQPIAYVAESAEQLEAFLANTRSAAAPLDRTPTPPPATMASSKLVALLSTATPASLARSASHRKVSPAARMLAAERGIDVSVLPPGSGPGGRILSTDVPKPNNAIMVSNSQDNATNSAKPMSKVHRTISKRLRTAHQTVPHLTMRMTIDADPLYAFHHAQKQSIDCTLNDILMSVCGQTLVEHPALRSQVEGDRILELPTSNIGIAVALDERIVVPVILCVERLSLALLAIESKRLISNSQTGVVENVGRGVLTISNLGVFGIDEFTAIITPPETAVLGVGAVREQAIVRDGNIQPGRVMTLTFSADHRVVNGAEAARFLATLKQGLENPKVGT